MAPMKKAATAMTKGALAETLAAATELKKAQCAKILNELAGVAATEVKKTGVFNVPGLARMKIRTKPATKPGFKLSSKETN